MVWSPLVLHSSKGVLTIVLEFFPNTLQQKEQLILFQEKTENDSVRLQDFLDVLSTRLGEITVQTLYFRV